MIVTTDKVRGAIKSYKLLYDERIDSSAFIIPESTMEEVDDSEGAVSLANLPGSMRLHVMKLLGENSRKDKM